MKKLLRSALVVFATLISSNAATYYIDYVGGYDGNAGTSKSMPWRRAPGMAGFGGKYSHVAGDQFIFKGGVTWPTSCYQWKITAGGSSDENRDYYGSDPTWFSGDSFTRPLFDFERRIINGWVSGAGVLMQLANYITWDNLEFANHAAPEQGVNNVSTWGCMTLCADTSNYITLTNSIVRDWWQPNVNGVMVSGGSGGGGFQKVNSGAGHVVTHCEFHQENAGVYSGTAMWNIPTVEYTHIHDTPQAIMSAQVVHHNHIHHLMTPGDPAAHSNVMLNYGSQSVHHNWIHDTASTAMVIYLSLGAYGPASGYVYNNIVYNVKLQPVALDTGLQNAEAHAYVFNNLLFGAYGVGNCIRVGNRNNGSFHHLEARNNHFITAGNPFAVNSLPYDATIVEFVHGNNLTNTPTEAAALGYTEGNLFQPLDAGKPTVDAGVGLVDFFPDDYLDQLRINPWDIGPYEYRAASPGVGAIVLSSESELAPENGGTVTLRACRTGGSSGAIGCGYETINGTATAGVNYTAVSGNLTWADGDTADKTIAVTILDTAMIGNKDFAVSLSNATVSGGLGSPASALVTLVGSGTVADTEPTDPGPIDTATTNIVIFVGDGMGFEHVQAGRLYRRGDDSTPLSLETLLYHGQAVTTLSDGTITDSATAATALATGYQHPANGIISMDGDQSIKTTILELAKAKGLRTGIITTDSISGATPGAFGAHEPDRSYAADIRNDYLMADTTYPHPASRPNVLFGGGFDDPLLIPGPNQTYVAVAEALGYEFVSTASGLSQIPQTDYALGLFGSSWTTMDPVVANNSAQPRLPEMVKKALGLLGNNNGAGFFLMVEGALIDTLSHSNDRNFAAEVAELDLAVEEAFSWARQTGKPLLVMVTADHETGGLIVPEGQGITPGTIPEMTFSTGAHTAANVPVYGNWPAGLDGQTIDNTETFYIMEDYLEGGKPPQITDLSVSAMTATGAVLQWKTLEPSDSKAVISGIAEPLVDNVRTVAHTLFCTGLQPGLTYTLTATSTDLAGYTGTAAAEFTTPSAWDVHVSAEPVVALGATAGTFTALAAPNDGLIQTITESTYGAGSGLQVEYTLNTLVHPSQITALGIYGAVSWTQRDGSSDDLVTEVRVKTPDGGFGWQPIFLSSETPFQAMPAGNYVDDAGNIIIRFTDAAAFKRERKDVLSVDCLIGRVECSDGLEPDPTRPANLSATATSSHSITLNWTDSSNEIGYEIWRCTQGADWVLTSSIAGNSTSHIDTGLAPSTSYTYMVRALSDRSYADSAQASTTTEPEVMQLWVPDKLTVRTAKGVINLTWTDTNTGETGYEVLRSTGSGDFQVLIILPADSAKHADATVASGVTYTYQVRAMLGTTQGPLSSAATAKAR